MASKDEREQALAAALRDNLRRRKAQARAAEDETPPVSESAHRTPR